MIDRIAEFVDSLHISVRAFEQQINASNGLIRKAITNNTDIQSKWLLAIAENYPQLDMNWLITGHGSMIRDESSKSPVVGAIPAITPIVTSNSLAGEAAAYYKMYEKKDEENKLLIEEIGSLKERLRQLESKTVLPTNKSPDNTGNPQKVTILPVNLEKKEKMSE